jgi:hypothetical protein
MADNRGFTNVPDIVVLALDELVASSYKLGLSAGTETDHLTRSQLQGREDWAYDNLLTLLNGYFTRLNR